MNHAFANGEATLTAKIMIATPGDLHLQWGLPDGGKLLVDDGSEQLLGVNIPGNSSSERTLLVTPNSAFVNGPSGAQAEVSAAFVECDRGAISDRVTITRYRAPYTAQLVNPLGESAIRLNGVNTATLTLRVRDETGSPVIDGTLANLSVDLGATVSPVIETMNGARAFAVVPGAQAGDAIVTAEVEGIIVTSTLHIRAASPVRIDLTATPSDLSGCVTTSALVATVRDDQGDPVAGVTVRIGVSDDDGSRGTVNGSQAVTSTTDANGQMIVNFVKTAGATGTVDVRAEYLVESAGKLMVVGDTSKTLLLSSVGNERRVYLPFVTR